LDKFAKDAEKGVISLLVAFYFRQAGQQMDISQTFEFTHKSFSEYLMAKRIVAQVKYICEEIEKNKKDCDEGFDTKDGLKKWIKLFGPKVLDNDIVRFIRNEIAVIHIDKLKGMKQLIIELINFELKNGLPVEREDLLGRKTYKEENHYAINAEKALFVVLSIITGNTNERSNIEWQSPTDFGNLLRRIIEQRTSDFDFMCQFLNHLCVKNCCLDFQDLYGANLRNTDFGGANLRKANLIGANLIGADLIGADLIGADLRGAYLIGADLREADLREANLREADLHEADLSGEHSSEHYRREADLRGADLNGADLNGANLRGANLNSAILSRVDLSGADLSGANLIGANLIGANLSRTNLSRVNLSRADLRGTYLIGADLIGANLRRAKLRKSDFINSEISESDWLKRGGIIEEG
jgi:uncharacterized protein YjbI with pentapeptide repeats